MRKVKSGSKVFTLFCTSQADGIPFQEIAAFPKAFANCDNQLRCYKLNLVTKFLFPFKFLAKITPSFQEDRNLLPLESDRTFSSSVLNPFLVPSAFNVCTLAYRPPLKMPATRLNSNGGYLHTVATVITVEVPRQSASHVGWDCAHLTGTNTLALSSGSSTSRCHSESWLSARLHDCPCSLLRQRAMLAQLRRVRKGNHP